MSRSVADLQRANHPLFDMLFRHQAYLDGLKLGTAASFAVVLKALYEDFGRFLATVNSLDQFSKGQLEAFIRRFIQVQQRHFNAYTQELIDVLQNFVAEDERTTHAIFSYGIGEATSQKSQKATAGIWQVANEEPIPANGLYLLPYLQSFSAYAANAIAATLRQGYANGDPATDTLAALVGKADAGYRDGLFARFAGQNQSLVNTVLQYVSAVVQSELASETFTQYQWVSILDSKTTVICRARDGAIYEYGKGPLPPAHYNCRSKAVPLSGETRIYDMPTSYYSWLLIQPVAFQNDLLGPANAAKLRSGEIKSKDFTSLSFIKPLTLAQFATKIKYILSNGDAA